jgi:hypothetical protein
MSDLVEETILNMFFLSDYQILFADYEVVI